MAKNYSIKNSKLVLGGLTPDSSAVLELQSLTQGFLAPRMTQTQRDAIASPANALLIFNTTAGQFEFYNAGTTSWDGLGGGGGGGVGTFTSAVDGAIMLSDGTTGDAIKVSPLSVNSDGELTLDGTNNFVRMRGTDGQILFDNTNTYGIGRRSNAIHFWFNTGNPDIYTFRIEQQLIQIRNANTVMEFVSTGAGQSGTIASSEDVGFSGSAGLTIKTGNVLGAGPGNPAGLLSLLGGDASSTNTNSKAGEILIQGGAQIDAGFPDPSAKVTIRGGANAGTGRGGDVLVEPGTSASGAGGAVLLGSPTLAPTANGGFPYIPALGSAPIGTPTAKTGFVPVVFDTFTNQLCIYTGGVWRKVTLT